MQDRLDLAVEVAILETIDEFVLVEVVGDRQVGDIDELVTVAQLVNDHDVVVTGRDQLAHEVAADESGTAGHNMH